ncbi:hypothetical protein BH10ACT6_BH10ACT6_00210 [soil metagenome]
MVAIASIKLLAPGLLGHDLIPGVRVEVASDPVASRD